MLHSAEFKALWDRIKHKTTYRVQFDNEKLMTDCAEAIRNGPPVTKTRVQMRKADLAIGQGGVEATETATSPRRSSIEESDIELPDVLTDLQDKTQLTRRSLARILTDSGRLDDFKRNPQQFIEIATEAINRAKRLALVDGIKYQRIGDEDYYAQELFEQEELTGYLKNMLAATKSVYEQVVYDSPASSGHSPNSWRRTRRSRSTPSCRAGSKSRRRSAPTTPTGPCWSRRTARSGCTSSSKPRAACSPTICGTRKAQRSSAARRISRRLLSAENPAQFVQARNIDDVMAKT